jgi:hypothetical protein
MAYCLELAETHHRMAAWILSVVYATYEAMIFAELVLRTGV